MGFSVVQDKLGRAQSHALDFDRACIEFFGSQPHRIIIHMEADPPHWLVFKWEVREPPPRVLALIYGDILTNLRGALDYLAWQLVLAGGHVPTDRTAFPCVKTEGNWGSACGDRLKGVALEWISEIEKFQP